MEERGKTRSFVCGLGDAGAAAGCSRLTSAYPPTPLISPQVSDNCPSGPAGGVKLHLREAGTNHQSSNPSNALIAAAGSTTQV